ncbi:glycoside hydrolase family 16 protein [Rossellomorea aquimaris]|uniref:glycoside hydrolase family 16 protein n=1 Tax=Rossellomorea aquimaris TaxID=189382 RepID=UPI001CD777DE|nr:glycoside hydrolase family 16 protein [Rossellomorea aquimaris]MCA1055389.1 glycoside hydrolase family 16 protein [Rossellomorea aquimaris]
MKRIFVLLVISCGFILTSSYETSTISTKNALNLNYDTSVDEVRFNKGLTTVSNEEWKLIFQDDFDTDSFNEDAWNGINKGWNYNNELQYYRKENIQVGDGSLKLNAKKEEYKGHTYTSAQINTKSKLEVHYGKIEIRARYDGGKGLFPAIWLLPADDSKTLPEVDIMEAIGQEPKKVYMVNHFGEPNQYTTNHQMIEVQDNEQFHTYTLEWNKSELNWYIDNVLYFSNRKGVPHEPMYLILNLAVGGNWPGNPDESTSFPSTFEIDSVKIYESLRR